MHCQINITLKTITNSILLLSIFFISNCATPSEIKAKTIIINTQSPQYINANLHAVKDIHIPYDVTVNSATAGKYIFITPHSNSMTIIQLDKEDGIARIIE